MKYKFKAFWVPLLSIFIAIAGAAILISATIFAIRIYPDPSWSWFNIIFRFKKEAISLIPILLIIQLITAVLGIYFGGKMRRAVAQVVDIDNLLVSKIKTKINNNAYIALFNAFVFSLCIAILFLTTF
jgi:hypothetical protein